MREDRTTETMTVDCHHKIMTVDCHIKIMTVDCHNKIMNSAIVTNNLSCTARLQNHKTLPISFNQWRPYQMTFQVMP